MEESKCIWMEYDGDSDTMLCLIKSRCLCLDGSYYDCYDCPSFASCDE